MANWDITHGYSRGEAITKAKELSLKHDTAVDVVGDARTTKWYCDESPSMIRNWETLVGTAEKGEFKANSEEI